jgi:predicted DNA binding protein
VEEDAIDEYTTTYSTEKPIVGGDYDEAVREVTITNRYEIKKMNIKVIKIWADAGNTDKLRPSELTFNLYKTVGDGEKELVQEFQLKSSNGNSVWKHKDLRTTLEGLNVYENGEKVHYSIEETTKLEGYTVKYIDNDIVGGNKVNDQYQTDFMTWVTNYHIIKRPNRLIGPMGMTSGECVE